MPAAAPDASVGAAAESIAPAAPKASRSSVAKRAQRELKLIEKDRGFVEQMPLPTDERRKRARKKFPCGECGAQKDTADEACAQCALFNTTELKKSNRTLRDDGAHIGGQDSYTSGKRDRQHPHMGFCVSGCRSCIDCLIAYLQLMRLPLKLSW